MKFSMALGRVLTVIYSALLCAGCAGGSVQRGPLSTAVTIQFTSPELAAFYDFNVQLMPTEHRLAASGSIELPASAMTRRFIELELREPFVVRSATVQTHGTRAAPARISRSTPTIW
jgi:hypothetical protein